MPSIDDVFASNYLKADDLHGREPTVTIKSVEAKEFKGNNGAAQMKLVVGFHGTKKQLVANVTNSQRIAYLHGKDYSTWVGKKITLFVDPFVQFGNEIKPAIRVKPPERKTGMVPVSQAPADTSQDEHDEFENPAEGIDDDIPF